MASLSGAAYNFEKDLVLPSEHSMEALPAYQASRVPHC